MARVLDGAFELSRREDRWLAMAEDRIAFAADTDAEWARLQTEARLIDRWRAAGVPVPRVLDENERERVQVRERLDGILGEVVEPLLFGAATLADVARISPFTRADGKLTWAVPEAFARAGDKHPWPLPDAFTRLDPSCPLSPFGARLAQSYGELAARMHGAFAVGEAAAIRVHGVGPVDDATAIGITTRPPFELDAALVQLRTTSIARELVDKAERARAWIAEGPPVTTVIHGDLHFHNMCLAEDGSIIGVFDIGDAHVDGAESEFHYVHSLGPRFVEIALAAYGSPLDEVAIRRAHVRTALGHLLFVPPDSPRWPAMVGWNTAVLTHLVPGEAAGT